MSRLNWFQRFYWQRLAKPVAERELFRHLLSRPFSSVLEIGVGDGSRMQRLAQLIQVSQGTEQLRYVGVDAFESASDGRPHLTLKQAHKLATQLGFRATFIPGDVASAVPRVASKIGASELVIIDGGLDPAQPASGPVGKWLQHITSENSLVLATATAGGPLGMVDAPKLTATRAAA
jgi:hypothetical protein